MSEQTKAPERKKLADGIYEGDLLLLELTSGQFFRGWIIDLLLSSDSKPAAFKTDQGMIDLSEVKSIRIGEVNYVDLNERIEAMKAQEALAEKATEEVVEG